MSRIKTCLKVARVAVQDVAWPVLSGLYHLLNDGITALQEAGPAMKYHHPWQPEQRSLFMNDEELERGLLAPQTLQDKLYHRRLGHPDFGTCYDPMFDDYYDIGTGGRR